MDVFWTVFGPFWGPVWIDCSSFLHHFFGYVFCIIVDRIVFESVSIFGTLYLQKPLFFLSGNAILEKTPLQNKFKKHIFWDGFWLAHFLINFSSILFFRHRFPHRFLDAFLTENDSKMVQKIDGGRWPFSTFFGVPTLGRILIDFGLPFGTPLVHLGSFWRPFGSMLEPLGSILDPPLWALPAPFWTLFWIILHPLGSILERFGLHLHSWFLAPKSAKTLRN